MTIRAIREALSPAERQQLLVLLRASKPQRGCCERCEVRRSAIKKLEAARGPKVVAK